MKLYKSITLSNRVLIRFENFVITFFEYSCVGLLRCTLTDSMYECTEYKDEDFFWNIRCTVLRAVLLYQMLWANLDFQLKLRNQWLANLSFNVKSQKTTQRNYARWCSVELHRNRKAGVHYFVWIVLDKKVCKNRLEKAAETRLSAQTFSSFFQSSTPVFITQCFLILKHS